MYLNNPQAVLDVLVDATQSQPLLRKALKDLIRTLVEQQTWKEASDEDIEISTLTGGITNVLYLARETKTSSKVIIRLYGHGTSEFIDRAAENIVFAQLSKAGFGPTFHGRFLNGRVEGFLSATALLSEQMNEESVYPEIAAAVAKLHSMDVTEIRTQGWLWAKINTFLDLVANGKVGFSI